MPVIIVKPSSQNTQKIYFSKVHDPDKWDIPKNIKLPFNIENILIKAYKVNIIKKIFSRFIIPIKYFKPKL